MKKHKSVVAILLAVMMIFAMMPSMVFAAGNPVKSWEGDTYGIAVDSSGAKFSTTRTFNSDGGLITAVPAAKASTVEGEAPVPAPEGTAYFYDLTGSSFVYGAVDATTKAKKALDGSTWTQKAFEEQLAPQVQLVEPSYAYSEANKKNPNYVADKAFVALTKGTGDNANTYTAAFGTWGLVVERSEYKSGIATDQTVTFTVKTLAPSGEVDASSAKPDLTGTIATATVTVKGKTKTLDDVTEAIFHLDTVDGAALNAGVYDGKAHTVVAEEVPGYSVSYQVLNPATGKYEAASAVTITDVQKTATQFKAIYTDAKGVATTKGPFSVNLAKLNTKRTVTIAWDKKASAVDPYYDDEADKTYNFLYLVDGTKYDAHDYIAITASEGEIPDKESAADATARVAMDSAAKNAIAANEAQLKDWFNTYYELKEVTSKRAAARDQVEVVISKKVLSEAEDKAATEKFAQLEANFGGFIVGKDVEAVIQLNADKIDYEIEFTKAPEGAKVVHIKKAKKLKKDKSFSVKAVSNKGFAVSYKLINANSKIKINKTTGKITLKKGLKKGTYKFKVKAYVPGYSASPEGYEVQNIVVKIKK